MSERQVLDRSSDRGGFTRMTSRARAMTPHETAASPISCAHGGVQFPQRCRCTAGFLQSSVCKLPGGAGAACTRGKRAVSCQSSVCVHAAPRFSRLAVRVLGKRQRRVASCGASPLIASRGARARYELKRSRARPSHVSEGRGSARKVARGCQCRVSEASRSVPRHDATRRCQPRRVRGRATAAAA